MPTPHDFPAALTRWRSQRKLTKKALARVMGFDPSYVSHIEAGRYPVSEEFARLAEQKLSAGGDLWRTWRESAGERTALTSAGVGELFVDDDHAELSYRDGTYTARMRRLIVNGGSEPVSRYLVRISVDRYPGQPKRSNELYRQHPLTWEQLDLRASCDGEPMRWVAKHDRDSFKEVWLRFENEGTMFPLYPGQAATLEYSYVVSEDQWGQWFQRAIRLPTRAVSVDLVLPAELHPTVWGTETSTTVESVPLRSPVQKREQDGDVRFSWRTNDPPIGARYRMEWRWRTDAEDRVSARPSLRTSSDRMAAAGIVQEGNPILAQPAAVFRFPEESAVAEDVVDQLHRAIQRVREHHHFGKGMGLAAPQIGIDRAAAIVLPPDLDAVPLVLLNPRIIDSSPEFDSQYEGCLSFFDVRGLVPRPRRVEVEHALVGGGTAITVFTDALARLVAHEVDHLHGLLYTSHMPEGVVPIPVEEYRGTGQAWSYRRA
ncbi:peptide deformylase [Nocardiopsis sp. HUAS JQ3]|uniref:peptide deformylase n=1 Tax=Nocardiopsis sp. HUAS JQ3 TaxID=3061629 RepID=UPI0023A9E124|nr:peptide deformylase [Nocardiopsis sp. HUAS JQ3]WDZ90379.1 peptide deformylase [Nocardiopsis sp. HUAS JQ3]